MINVFFHFFSTSFFSEIFKSKFGFPLISYLNTPQCIPKIQGLALSTKLAFHYHNLKNIDKTFISI